MVLKLCN